MALALREIGRVERTLFTLDWIEWPKKRRQATRKLNKGEAQNALKRAIFFAHEDRDAVPTSGECGSRDEVYRLKPGT